MASRVLAVLAAVFLVGAAAIVGLLPIGTTLGQGLQYMDGSSLAWLQRHSLGWAWIWLEAPLLFRPMWLLPAVLGLICAGGAVSLNFGKTSPSRRRRS